MLSCRSDSSSPPPSPIPSPPRQPSPPSTSPSPSPPPHVAIPPPPTSPFPTSVANGTTSPSLASASFAVGVGISGSRSLSPSPPSGITKSLRAHAAAHAHGDAGKSGHSRSQTQMTFQPATRSRAAHESRNFSPKSPTVDSLHSSTVNLTHRSPVYNPNGNSSASVSSRGVEDFSNSLHSSSLRHTTPQSYGSNSTSSAHSYAVPTVARNHIQSSHSPALSPPPPSGLLPSVPNAPFDTAQLSRSLPATSHYSHLSRSATTLPVPSGPSTRHVTNGLSAQTPNKHTLTVNHAHKRTPSGGIANHRRHPSSTPSVGGTVFTESRSSHDGGGTTSLRRNMTSIVDTNRSSTSRPSRGGALCSFCFAVYCVVVVP